MGVASCTVPAQRRQWWQVDTDREASDVLTNHQVSVVRMGAVCGYDGGHQVFCGDYHEVLDHRGPRCEPPDEGSCLLLEG
jgi:hypothetical protein